MMHIKIKILVFGTGRYYQSYKEKLDKYDIVAFLDNDITKQNIYLDSKKIYPPSQIEFLKFDFIYLMGKDWQNMKLQLLAFGIKEDIIRNYLDLEKEYIPWEMPAVWRTDHSSKYFDFALISFSLGLTGAPMALLNLARVLKANGYSPIIVSNEDGALKNECLKADIPVSIDEKINTDICEIERWVLYTSNALINTIMYCPLLEKYSLKIPILLWVHEAKQYYEEIRNKIKIWKLPSTVVPLAVGNIAARNYEHYFKVKPYILLYGLEKYAIEKRKDSKYIVTIIGSICERKGQALLLKAYINLPIELQQNIKIWVIGEGNINFLKGLSDEDKDQIRETPNIIFWGQVMQKEMKRFYSQTDLLVCPSLEDPMPITVTEALMNEIPVIVSDKCGTSVFINNYSSGVIVKSGNIEDLSEKLEWCYYHQEELEICAKNNQIIFEKYFSLRSLQENLKKIIKGVGMKAKGWTV